jgi:hypothetical protein
MNRDIAMDAIQAVKEARVRYPDIPLIVIHMEPYAVFAMPVGEERVLAFSTHSIEIVRLDFPSPPLNVG